MCGVILKIFKTGKEFRRILWNPNVQNCVNKSLSQDPILSEIYSGHIPINYISNLYFKLIFFYRLFSKFVSSLQVFQLKCFRHFSVLSWVPHVSTIPFSLTLYVVESTTWSLLRKLTTYSYNCFFPF
jgi:hypothetical protein